MTAEKFTKLLRHTSPKNCHGPSSCCFSTFIFLSIALHMKSEPEEWLILGVIPNGRPFRPSDWSERLCGALASYDNHGRWVYSEHAQPIIHEGQMGVRIKTVLKNSNLGAYKFIMDFACDNQLKVVSRRKVIYLNEPAAVPEVALSVRELKLAL